MLRGKKRREKTKKNSSSARLNAAKLKNEANQRETLRIFFSPQRICRKRTYDNQIKIELGFASSKKMLCNPYRIRGTITTAAIILKCLNCLSQVHIILLRFEMHTRDCDVGTQREQEKKVMNVIFDLCGVAVSQTILCCGYFPTCNQRSWKHFSVM